MSLWLRAKRTICRHDYGPWRVGFMPSLAEISGDVSDKAWDEEQAVKAELGLEGLPGVGLSKEAEATFEHRVCPKCGNVEVRPPDPL